MTHGSSGDGVRRPYHYPLDLIRFAAATSVMAFHLAFYTWASAPGSSTANAFRHATSYSVTTPWTWFGWVGVEVFFVISGFVIANSAVGATSGSFLKSRVLRLLPAAWICASITLLVREFGGLERLDALVGPYVASLALWPAGPWIDGVYWSLAVEVTFYALVFGLLRFRAFSLLPQVAWLLVLASGLFIGLSISGLDRSLPGWWMIRGVSEPLLLRHGAFFALGVWIWMSSERRLRPSDALGVAAAAAIGCAEIWMRGQALQDREALAAAGQPLILPILLWLSAVTVLAFVTRAPERFTPRSAVVRRGLRWMGLATYPLYLTHNDVGATMMRLLVQAGAPKWAALAVAVMTVVSIAFAVALVFEPRVRQILRRLIELAAARGRTGAGAVASAP